MVDRLYILMRNDLNSLNPGKACAQAAHAANMCVETCPSSHFLQLGQWLRETDQGFGTTIVLAADEKEMRETVEAAKFLGLHTGIVHDPTYPLRDGQITHLIPLDTCAFIFGDKTKVESITDDLYLMD